MMQFWNREILSKMCGSWDWWFDYSWFTIICLRNRIQVYFRKIPFKKHLFNFTTNFGRKNSTNQYDFPIVLFTWWVRLRLREVNQDLDRNKWIISNELLIWTWKIRSLLVLELKMEKRFNKLRNIKNELLLEVLLLIFWRKSHFWYFKICE